MVQLLWMSLARAHRVSSVRYSEALYTDHLSCCIHVQYSIGGGHTEKLVDG